MEGGPVAVIVQKYGGTSVQDHELVLRVAHRVAGLRSQGNDVVVVVSARGETTDRLMQEARRFTDAPEQRELDMLMSAGERISMSLLAIALNSIGCSAVSFTGSQAGAHTTFEVEEAEVHILWIIMQDLANDGHAYLGGRSAG